MTLHQKPDTVDPLMAMPRPVAPGGFRTHEIQNMPPELPEQNLFTANRALTEAMRREGIEWADERLSNVGQTTGSTRMRELARLANTHKPELKTHDRIGQRIDFVEYHPAYHEIMRAEYKSGVHSLPWSSNEKRPHVARAMISYMWNQCENGTGCPNAMSFAMTPLLRSDPEVGNRWLDGVLSQDYDPRPLPADQKTGLTVAMSMTEKQGGSDLRTNDTRAVPTGNPREYALTGHKFFCSAPMGDLVLLTAQTENGVSLFVTPRSLPDGTRNTFRIQRLKDKLGNISNASSEIELDNTIAYLIGEEGKGIRTFIRHMTHFIRMELGIASAGIMRQALTLAIHHTSHRSAFGGTIRELPQMRNALADMALETEAALLLGLRGARATDDAQEDDSEGLLNRILVPITKYWNCRRVGAVTLEALECHGGMGFVEEQPIARFYREAPLNSIWEGTSAIMGLDMIRALQRDPGTRDALMAEIRLAAGADRYLDAYTARLDRELSRDPEGMEPDARRIMGMIANAMQASLMLRQSTNEAAEAFCASRLGDTWGHEFGTLDTGPATLKKIVDRAALA